MLVPVGPIPPIPPRTPFVVLVVVGVKVLGVSELGGEIVVVGVLEVPAALVRGKEIEKNMVK